MGHKLQKYRSWSLSSFVTIFHESISWGHSESLWKHKEELLLWGTHRWRVLE